MNHGAAFDCSVRLDDAMIRAGVAAGYKAAYRYLYPDWSAPKTVQPDEARRIVAGGLSLGLVWETTAGRALDGYPAGVADAHDALALVDHLGAPAAGCAIYFACDTDATFPQVAPYYRGTRDAIAGHVDSGAYGGIPVVRGARDAGYTQLCWIAAASSWNHGETMADADLQQLVGPAPGLGFDADANTILSRTPGVNPPLFPPAPPAPHQETPGMLHVTVNGYAFLVWCSENRLLYRGIQSGSLAGAVTLTDQADPANPLLVLEETPYGPVVYGAGAGNRTTRTTWPAKLPDGTPLAHTDVL